MKPQSDNELSAFVGIDWTDAKPDICLQPANYEVYSPLPAQQRTDRSLIPTGIGTFSQGLKLPQGSLALS